MAKLTPSHQATKSCKHQKTSAIVNVVRLEDSDRYMAELAITCNECNKPFRFLGLSTGIDLDGATVSVDGQELRVGIVSADEQPAALAGHCAGFTVQIGMLGVPESDLTKERMQ